MKHIVFIVYELINSGPENVLYDICANIDRTEFNPLIVTLRSNNSTNSIEPKFIRLGIAVKHYSFSTIQLELKTSWVAKRIEEDLSSIGGFIIHAHGHHPTLIAALMRATSIATIHCISGEDYILKKGKILGNYMAYRFNHCLKRVDRVIVISDYMMQYYQRFVTKNLALIHNGVSVNYDRLNSNLKKERLNIASNTYVVVVIGSVSRRKNTSQILQELRKSTCKDFLCLIVGDGLELGECKKMVEHDRRFRFEGHKSDVSEYLNIADLCVSASLSEGLPLSILESINAGVPVLMSNIPPHLEIERILSLAPVKTFSLQRNNLLDSFEGMKRISFNHEELRRKANKLFSAHAMSKKYQSIYNQCFDR